MDINELETYRLSDAVKFHDRLNPALWGPGETMLPEVREKLLAIADDFREFLGIDVEVQDITVSGSNAAYTYTPNSDIDLHLVVDLPKADASDIYRELFDAKKYAYNDQHDFKIGGYDVELYVQNANEPHHSQGIYSIKDTDWVRVPSRRRPEVNDISVESKYRDLAERIDAAVQSGDLARMDALAAKIRDMRAAGLEKTGEFGAENLAFKVLRNNGTLERLRDARRAAKDQVMSLEERRKKKAKKKKTKYAYGSYFFPGYHYYGDTGAAADGGGDGGGGGESVRESVESQQDVIQRFVQSCSDFLGMERCPEIKLRQDPEWSRRNGTFGRYTADPEHRIELATAGRHIVDILRTLAHEMTHARQNEVTGLPDDAGETGSEYEDSANAMAGRIMRHWAESEPEMFRGVDLDEQAQDDQQPTGPGVLGALRTIQNIGRAARNLPTQVGAQEELSQELKNWLRRQGGQTDQPTNLPLPDVRQQQESAAVNERAAPRSYTNDQLDQIAVRYAQQYRVPVELVRHVMQKETGGLPPDLRVGARSPKGAIGVMQLMPATADELGVDPRDPAQNIEGGVRYLRQQLDSFGGNHQLAMMAYNWGPGNVRRWRSRGSDPRRMPRETRNYIAGYSTTAPRTQVARAPATTPRTAAPQPPASAPRRTPAQSAQSAEQQQRERLRQQELERIDRILQRDTRQAQQRRRDAFEASGYIPTAKERNDPRFSMALTVDVHPGETGKQANKLALKTDSQGRPALLMKKLNNLLEEVKLDEKCWDGYRKQGMKKKGDRMVPNCVPVAEAVPQSGESSGAPSQFKPGAEIQTRRMTVPQIISGVRDVPYVNNVIDDWDAKDHSWPVTKKTVEYATYLKNNPQSVTNLPPIVVIDGRLDDGAHRLSAINLLQKRMDPNNPLWKTVKLEVKFGRRADVIPKPVAPVKAPTAEPGARPVLGQGGAFGGPGPKLPMPGQIMPRNESRIVEDEELTEVKMSPAEFQKFLRSPAAEGIRAGFEAELIFRDTQSDVDGGESEPDYDADERAYSIDDIISFFTGGDGGIGPGTARRLQDQLMDSFSEYAQQQFADDYFDLARFQEWADDNVWPDVDDQYRDQARDDLGDEATDEQIESEAVSLFRDDVERDWDRSGEWYNRAYEELYDEYYGDLDQDDWLDSAGLRYMSNVAEEYGLDWPYWTDGSGSGGTRDWQEIANGLERVTGMPVRVSSGYHGAARRPGQYIIEPDSSLDSDDPDDYGLEVVSPPLPLPEAVEQLRRIIDWANGPGDAYTNSSTGLHMGVSLPFRGGDVDPVKLILFMGDRNVLETFGRESNTYARSAYERLESKIRGMKNAGQKQIAGVMELMKRNLIELADREFKKGGLLGDKYVSVHPQDGYIEFRGPGGDYLAKSDEIDGVLENTMLRLAYAMSIAGDPAAARQEYAKKLYKMLTGYRGTEISRGPRDTKYQTKIETEGENPFMRLFADYSAGTLSGEELKAKWADTVLAAERGDAEDDDVEDVPVGTPQEYEVYDRATGEVYTTFQARNDDEAIEQFSRHHRAPYAQRGLPVLRVKAPGRKGKESTSRRAELAKRVTRSTRDVGEQLWRVNHHSSQRWVVARSQAEAVAKAIQQDRMFDNPETRARIATDQERQQWQLDQEARALRQRDSEQDTAQIRARLGAPQTAGGEPTGEWSVRDRAGFLVTTLRPPEAMQSQDGAERYAQNWIARSRPDLDASDITVTQLTTEREPIPGSTLDIQRQRQQGEFTGAWEIRDGQGRELHRFSGIGNSQADANRFAASWLGRNRPDLVGQEVDVVPVMR